MGIAIVMPRRLQLRPCSRKLNDAATTRFDAEGCELLMQVELGFP